MSHQGAAPRETHRNVVVGVTILALLALFVTFFTIGIIAAGIIDPPESSLTLQGGLEVVTIGDYFTPPRLAIGAVAGIVGAALLWAIVSLIVYPAPGSGPHRWDDEDEDDRP